MKLIKTPFSYRTYNSQHFNTAPRIRQRYKLQIIKSRGNPSGIVPFTMLVSTESEGAIDSERKREIFCTEQSVAPRFRSKSPAPPTPTT
uniref:Uncharacterized protein n=1 Tax=Setaria italica TaxID=4555 RepID=K3XNR2_SETIT